MTDVFIPGALGGLSFTRTFSSATGSWYDDNPFDEAPAPFGASPLSQWVPQWTHSAVALVTTRPNYWSVRDTNGRLLRFAPCDAGSCWAPPLAGNVSIPERLLKASSSRYELWQGSGDRLVFEGAYVRAGKANRYFLTEVKTPADAGAIQVSYLAPAQEDGGALTCLGGDAGSGPGVPYLRELKSPEATLRFYYSSVPRTDGGPTECVITSAALVAPGGALTPVVAYSYGQGTAGLVSQAVAGQRDDRYVVERPDGGGFGLDHWRGELGGALTLRTAHDGTIVTGDNWAHKDSTGNLSVSWDGGVGACGETATLTIATDNLATRGDGAAGAAGLKTTYWTVENNGQTHEPRILQRTDTCTVANSCSPGTVRTDWTCSDGGAGIGYELGTQNKRGYWTANTWAQVDGGARGQVLEKRSTTVGAASSTGTGLETETYGYVYGVAEQQLLSTTQTDSVLGGAGTKATTTRWYDSGSNRLKKLTRTGYTWTLAGGLVQRTVGIFFNNSSSNCGVSANPDAYGRTLEVHGPCELSAESANDCPGTQYPLTVYKYYLPTDNTPNRNRLESVTRSPNGTTCSPGLVVSLAQYDVRGNPGTVTDENGVATSYTYDAESHVLSWGGRGGATTLYRYLDGKLVAIRYPLGNGELFEYGGTQSLQWKAKVACGSTAASCAVPWSERVDYAYAADGSLARAEFRTCAPGSACSSGTAGEVRKVEVFASDAHKRPTLHGFGDGGTFREVKMFNRNDAVSGVGHAFDGAPAFCDGSDGGAPDEPYSKLCNSIRYDEADRIKEVDAFPDAPATTNGTRTCLGHDSQGNTTRVEPGIAYGSTCPADPTAASSDYEYDDFGDIIKVSQPFMTDGADGGKGFVRQEFDAMGNLLKKQTPDMRAQATPVNLRFTYDTLGRLLESRREGGGDVLLYSLGYDSDEAVDTGCSSLAYANGRLSLRNDSFGKTWYLYDSEGRVLKESRLRSGLTTCSNQTRHDIPSTLYGYDLNGNMTSIEYPHGRTVTYPYSQTYGANRPAAITYQIWTGSAWGTPDAQVSDILWEPYGGLRAYNIIAGEEPTWVEYFRGGSLEIAPTQTSCSSWPAPGTWGAHDGSGRPRGVYVTQGEFTPGTPTGDIFRQEYTWNKDMLVAQHTCHRNSGTVVAESFTYDKTLRLTAAATSAASSNGEGFVYDKRGSRTRSDQTGPSCDVASDLVAGRSDLLEATRWGDGGTPCGSAIGKYLYANDRDGRRASMTDVSNNFQVDHSYAQADIGSGLDSVYRQATITGGNYVAGAYGYLYDAFNRRRARTTPWSSTDEYFHDLGHQLLSDRGGEMVGSTTSDFPEDDYLWLGGRPVVIIRSKFDSSWARYADGTGFCARNGVQNICSTNYPVTDYLGKPAVMLSWATVQGGTAGSARYLTFGAANRREARYSTPHNQVTSGTVMTINDDMPPGFDGWARVLFNKVHLSKGSSVTFNERSQFSPSRFSLAHVWSTSESRGSTGWALTYSSTDTNSYGFDMEAYEVNLKQYGVYQFWTPLRLPGQYYDAETELHENWNRYYDPRTGTYLQPEPLLQNSRFSSSMAMSGRTTPAYSYAANNPLTFVDPNGLWIVYDFSNTDLVRQIDRFKSTPSGMALWERLDERPEWINLEEMRPQISKTNKGKIRIKAGSTSPFDGKEVTCKSTTYKSFEGLGDLDPASIIGHELTHAESDILYPGQTRDTREQRSRDFQQQILRELHPRHSPYLVRRALAQLSRRRVPELRLKEARKDGGVVGDLVGTRDGGAAIRWRDGGSSDVPVDPQTFCEADAGKLLGLLAQNRCRSDSDCSVIRPALPLRGVDFCYAISATVAKSAELEAERRALGDRCGSIYEISSTKCDKAVCMKGRCRPW